MGNPIAKKLKSYAIARHHAYVSKDRLDQPKAQAVTHIIRVCDHFKAVSYTHLTLPTKRIV